MKKFAHIAVLLVIAAVSLPSHAADGPSLKLPPGASVAIVVFEDLECPDCANAYPLLRQAAKTYGIPLVVHEFPLPKHRWAFAAAVYARFFDAQSERLGDLFRTYIYQNQADVTSNNLRQYAENFAHHNDVPLPTDVDPEEKLKQAVQADYKLGQSINLQYTPTIFVLDGETAGDSLEYFEVTDRSQLNQIIEERLKKVHPVAPAKRAAVQN